MYKCVLISLCGALFPFKCASLGFLCGAVAGTFLPFLSTSCDPRGSIGRELPLTKNKLVPHHKATATHIM